MKRLFILALCCLLLCGCSLGPEPEPSTEATTLPAVEPTEPPGCYDPESLIEQQTAGAVRAYPLDISDAREAVFMGEDILVFSGGETTTLTRLSGDTRFVTAQIQAGQYLSTEDPSVLVNAQGVAYYSEQEDAYILLDAELQEQERISLPENVMGSPVLTPDREKIYYCTEDTVRERTVQSGVSRLLKKIAYPSQSVRHVLLEAGVLRLELCDERGEYLSQYLSTENGETLWEGPDTVDLTVSRDSWFAAWMDGILPAYVYSLDGAEPRMLVPENWEANGWFLPEMECLVLMSPLEEPDPGVILDCYDLKTGLLVSSLTLEAHQDPLHLDGNPETGEICVLGEDLEGFRSIYLWDVNALPAGGDQVVTGPWYTLEDPDTEGLAQCAALAEEIGQRHGVQILIGFDAVADKPWDYDLTAEYQVPIVTRKLEELDRVLSVFPQGMLTLAAEGTEDGVLKISLVREIRGDMSYDSLTAASGLSYWQGGNVYIAQSAGADMAYTLCHELYHVLETRLLSSSDACYDWEYLNPKGFDYLYSYSDYLELDSKNYLEDETRYFIDVYSMTFPAEDRARILEYAMNPGNEHYFQSDAMQGKLRALCLGLREAYGLEDYPESFLWERYLEKPLVKNS